MNKIRLAMLLFVASEAVFFIPLILAYVVYHATSPSAADASRYLDIPRTAVFTACLISSSFTMRHAGMHFRQRRLAQPVRVCDFGGHEGQKGDSRLYLVAVWHKLT